MTCSCGRPATTILRWMVPSTRGMAEKHSRPLCSGCVVHEANRIDAEDHPDVLTGARVA